MTLSVSKSGAACGAEIHLDLFKEVDDRVFREIEYAFHDNIVVCFRGQQLSNERHIEFSRRFGELEIHVLKKYLLSRHPEILLISNIKDENGENIGLADAGFTWHTDVSYLKSPESVFAAVRQGSAVPRRSSAWGYSVRQYASRIRGVARRFEESACRVKGRSSLLGAQACCQYLQAQVDETGT